MESTEFYAKLLFYARMLGGEKEIPCGEVKKLVELRKQFGVPGKHLWKSFCPGCYEGDDTCSMSPTEANEKYGVESSAAYHVSNRFLTVVPTPSSSNKDMESLVAEVTKKVMEQLNK